MKSPFDVSTGSPTTAKPNQWLIGVVMLCAGLFVGAVVMKNGWIPDPAPIVIDDETDDEQRESVALEGSYIVRVYETEAHKQSPWLIKILDSDSFWFDWINDQGMRYFTFDPDNKDQATSFIAAAKRQNIDPPFWLWAKEGNVLAVQPFRDGDSTDSIKKILGAK